MVSIAAFQANDPGSFHGLRIYKKTQKNTKVGAHANVSPFSGDL